MREVAQSSFGETIAGGNAERFMSPPVGVGSLLRAELANRRKSKMKLFTAAAVAILFTSGMAYAQQDGQQGGQQDGATTGSTNDNGGGSDASDYLGGPNIHRFYTDEKMGTLRPDAEVKSTWETMTPEEQANLKQACQGNQDTRWSTLCNSIGSM